jgi:hypothetical protein
MTKIEKKHQQALQTQKNNTMFFFLAPFDCKNAWYI